MCWRIRESGEILNKFTFSSKEFTGWCLLVIVQMGYITGFMDGNCFVEDLVARCWFAHWLCVALSVASCWDDLGISLC